MHTLKESFTPDDIVKVAYIKADVPVHVFISL